jgi:hypothetical protein
VAFDVISSHPALRQAARNVLRHVGSLRSST